MEGIRDVEFFKGLNGETPIKQSEYRRSRLFHLPGMTSHLPQQPPMPLLHGETRSATKPLSHEDPSKFSYQNGVCQ